MSYNFRIKGSLILFTLVFAAACNQKSMLSGIANLVGSNTGASAGSSSPVSTPSPVPPSSSGFVYNSAGSNPNGYNIGMNVPGISYYNGTPIYADLTYQMSGNNGPWDANTGGAAPLDPTGAPTVAASAAFTSAYVSGTYSLSWDGTGSINVSGSKMGTPLVTTQNGVQHTSVTVAIVSNPTSDGLGSIRVTASPPLTNIHFLAPASEQVPGTIFVKSFLKKTAPFSTLRFMDSLATNNNTVKSWSQRTWPNGGSRANTKQGMAYEDIVALANLTGKDVWINIPVLATDDYVCRLARLFRYGETGSDDNGSNCSTSAPNTAPVGAVGLNTTSRVYVEFSNEIWNWGFCQVQDLYCMQTGARASTNSCSCNVTAPTSVMAQGALSNKSLNWTGDTNQMALILTKRDNDIFKAVFGSRASQIITVFNVQSANGAAADGAFKFFKAGYGSVSGSVDAMAVAPYFGLDANSYGDTVDDLFSDLSNVLLPTNPNNSGNSMYQWIKGDLAEAKAYNLALVAYEGGQGLAGASGSNSVDAVERTAQTDPRMFLLNQQFFSIWDQIVGRSHLFNYYVLSSTGLYGALINATDPGSQKYDSLLSLILLPGDANGDGKVDQADCAIVQSNFGQSGMYWSQGDFNHDGRVDSADLAILNKGISGIQCSAP